MNKKMMAALAAPVTVLALSLTACGSGSAPGVTSGNAASPASSQSTSAAPASSPSASADASSGSATSAGPTSAASTESAGGPASADVGSAAKTFASKNAGFTVMPTAQIKSQLSGAATSLQAVTVKPAACKELMIKSVSGLPADMDLSMAMKTGKAGATTVAFYSNVGNYLKDTEGIVNQMVSSCKTMQQSVAGQDLEVSVGKWSPSTQGDQVFGTTETTKMSTGTIVQTKVYAQRGNTAVQVQVMGDQGGSAAEAEANKLVDAAFASLEG